MDHAPFKNQPAQPELGPCRVLLVLLHRVGGRDVEDELVLEVGKHDDDEPGNAAEGQGVRPEAPVLELPRTGADVGRAGAAGLAAGDGGEVAEDERGDRPRVRVSRVQGLEVEFGGAEERGEVGSEARGEESRGHGKR